MFIPDPSEIFPSRIRIFSIRIRIFSIPDSRIRIFSIPDPRYDFFPSGSQISIKEFRYFNAKKWFLRSRKYDLGCSSRIHIPDPDHYFLPIPDPRSQGQKAPDPGSATLVVTTEPRVQIYQNKTYMIHQDTRK
jgi:hypothetical protein